MIKRLSENLGKGLVAGVVGTAAMPLSSTLEAKLRDRGSSNAPATAGAKVLGVKPAEESEARFGELVHWGYGTSLGSLRGLIGTLGLRGVPATVAHLVVIWSAEQVMLPATGAAPPVNEWGGEEIAIDVLHHGVYAVATGVVYSWLDRSSNDDRSSNRNGGKGEGST